MKLFIELKTVGNYTNLACIYNCWKKNV